ncbi:glycosyltransferase [Lysinibacillus sp. NPDC093190]|uniref:glycosyltransferase n=1 Tax=Lysinibacillus sp. NPDC093190 TaxID=3390575 RepID=UPI003D010ADC
MLASILINNYNYAIYLEECINSLLHQTYKNIEIIVYDDGSIDTSIKILSQYPNVRVIANENYGRTPNLNQMNAVYQAFKASRGDIVFLLDSDDFFKQDKVEKIVKLFNDNPHIDVIQHPLEEVNQYGKTSGNVVPVLKKIHDYKDYIFSTTSLFHLFASTSGLAFRRKFLNCVLPLKEDNLSYIWLDTRIMQLAALQTNIFSINEPFTYYRIHDSNNHSGKLGGFVKHQEYTEQLYRYFNQIAAEYGLPAIQYSYEKYLENTYFYSKVDKEKCFQFIRQHPTKEYWIWGAGEAGQSVYHALKDCDIRFAGFIDSDERKQGCLVMEKEVMKPESLYDKESICVLVSPYHAYDVIADKLKSNNFSENQHFINPYEREI